MASDISAFSAAALNGTLDSKPDGKGPGGSWFQAIADAWGKTLDSKASELENLANGPEGIAGGNDTPAAVTKLTAVALQFQYLSNASHTQLTAVGSGLETSARKG
jgi:hypothetical protein